MCFACGNYNIVLTWHIYTHIHICTHSYKHTHTHTHTHTDRQTNTHTDLHFAIFWKDRETKYTNNWQLRQCSSAKFNTHKVMFLMKTSHLKKILGKLREIN